MPNRIAFLHQMQFDATLPGFEQIFRFWDPGSGKVLAKILPGEYYLTVSPAEFIVTVLGSCISACIRDPKAGVGGMNHFMLPGTTSLPQSSSVSRANCYGVFAMESLINGIIKNGGDRNRLEVKVTGGGRIVSGPGSVANSNVHFIRQFLKLEGFRPHAVDLGGMHPRKVQYCPLSGRLRVKKLACLHDPGLTERETRYQTSLTQLPVSGTVELF